MCNIEGNNRFVDHLTHGHVSFSTAGIESLKIIGILDKDNQRVHWIKRNWRYFNTNLSHIKSVYHISAYSFRGNYSFLNVENVEIFI